MAKKTTASNKVMESRRDLPKVAKGKSAPRVKFEGINLRQEYRSRLSMFRAKECTAAEEKTCRCRCAGTLHGRDHKPLFDLENPLFMEKGFISHKDYFNKIIKVLQKKYGNKRK